MESQSPFELGVSLPTYQQATASSADYVDVSESSLIDADTDPNLPQRDLSHGISRRGTTDNMSRREPPPLPPKPGSSRERDDPLREVTNPGSSTL